MKKTKAVILSLLFLAILGFAITAKVCTPTVMAQRVISEREREREKEREHERKQKEQDRKWERDDQKREEMQKRKEEATERRRERAEQRKTESIEFDKARLTRRVIKLEMTVQALDKRLSEIEKMVGVKQKPPPEEVKIETDESQSQKEK